MRIKNFCCKPIVMAALAAAIAAPCIGSDSAMAQSPSIKSQIVGSWETVSVISEMPDGSKRDLYAGKVLRGLSIYTTDGRFSQVNITLETAPVSSGNRQTVLPAEAQGIVKQNYAIFGTYTVNEADKTYTVHIDGSVTFPNETGREQVRQVIFSGNTLSFVNPAPASGGKGATNLLRRVD